MTPSRLEPGRTAFLDRDGTINRPATEGDYIRRPEELVLLPGAAEAIRTLNELPAQVVVVTNQRGIDLGLMSEEDLAAVNERLRAELAAGGARLDAIYHCPHGRDECDCRKPGTGMFEQATREHDRVEIEGAAMIGDSPLDIEAGRRLGITTVRLGPTAAGEPRPDHEAADLLAAVAWLTESPTD